jgi:hypothetical protein
MGGLELLNEDKKHEFSPSFFQSIAKITLWESEELDSREELKQNEGLAVVIKDTGKGHCEV